MSARVRARLRGQRPFAAVAAPDRESRVMTQTDAFGRARVKRQRNGKPVKDSRRIIKAG